MQTSICLRRPCVHHVPTLCLRACVSHACVRVAASSTDVKPGVVRGVAGRGRGGGGEGCGDLAESFFAVFELLVSKLELLALLAHVALHALELGLARHELLLLLLEGRGLFLKVLLLDLHLEAAARQVLLLLVQALLVLRQLLLLATELLVALRELMRLLFQLLLALLHLLLLLPPRAFLLLVFYLLLTFIAAPASAHTPPTRHGHAHFLRAASHAPPPLGARLEESKRRARAEQEQGKARARQKGNRKQPVGVRRLSGRDISRVPSIARAHHLPRQFVV